MEFPRFVFKNGGSIQRAGGSYSESLVKNQAEMDAMLDEGWFENLSDAIHPRPAQPLPVKAEPDEAPPTRAELEAKALELGIDFSPRIGDVKLAERIQAALDEKK